VSKNYRIIIGLVVVCLLVGIISFLLFFDKDRRTSEIVKFSRDDRLSPIELFDQNAFVVSPSLQEGIASDINELTLVLQGKKIQDRFLIVNQENAQRPTPALEDKDLSEVRLDGEISRVLEIFQEDHPQKGFVEIFITDVTGNTIGQTNTITEYYHGDALWWQKAKEGIQYGNIEQDSGSGALSLPVSFPIKNINEVVVGVGRIAIDVTAIRR